MNNILPWPALIGRLRFLMDVDQAQIAGHLGIDEPTIESWERGILVPERQTQKILRHKLHRLEPAISLKAIEAMPVIAAVHNNAALELCCAASQPYAETYRMRAANCATRSSATYGVTASNRRQKRWPITKLGKAVRALMHVRPSYGPMADGCAMRDRRSA